MNESRATPKAGMMELWNSGITERRKNKTEQNKTKQNKNKQTNPTGRNHGTAENPPKYYKTESQKAGNPERQSDGKPLEILNDETTKYHPESLKT